MNEEIRNDSIFLESQLQYIENKFYDVKHPVKVYAEALPIDNTADEGAETIVYQMFDSIGMAKIVAADAKDLPLIEATGAEYVARVKSLGAYIRLSTQELRAAKLANRNIESMKINDLYDSFSRKENSIAWTGDVAAGIKGFLNHPNLPLSLAPLGATSAVRPWASKLAIEIYDDVMLALGLVYENSGGNFMPDTMCLPLAQYRLISTKRLGIDTNLTVLDAVMITAGKKFGLTNVYAVPELNNAFTGGTADGALFYVKNPDVVSFRVPMERKLLAGQWDKLGYDIPAESRVAGIVLRYPIACLALTGI